MSRIVLARIAGGINAFAPPPSGIVGVFYYWTVRPGRRYVVTQSGTLPAGLTWGSAFSTISGTPTVAGSFPITITLTGPDRTPVSFPFVIRIAPVRLILFGSLFGTGVGQPILGSIEAQGGTGPYTLTGVSETPPVGVTYSMTSGVITASGNALALGAHYVNFSIRDSAGATARIQKIIQVAPVAAQQYVDESAEVYVDEFGTPYISDHV